MRHILAGLSLGPFAFMACVVVASCDSTDPDAPDAGADANTPDVKNADANTPDADADAAPACTAQQVLCNGVCVDPMTNVDNCGTCGHACGCGSTSCTSGMCDPAVLADKQGGPYALALSGGNLYWGADSDRTLSRVSIAGGDAKVLYPGRTAIRGIAPNATRLFFSRTVFNIVESSTIDGSSSGNFTNAREPGAYGIAVDAAHVYWADSGEGTIRTAAVGAPVQAGTTLLTGQTSPTSLVIDTNYIYWTTTTATGTVMRMSKTAGSTTAIALASNQANPRGLAVDANYVYWANQGDGTNKGTINRVPIAGGTVTPLVTGRQLPGDVAIDANFVYWTDQNAGTIEKAPLAGGPVTQLAVNQSRPIELELDASCIYFTVGADGAVGTGSIRKASK